MLTHQIPRWKDVKEDQWNDWRWQMRNKIRCLDELSSIVTIARETTEELSQFDMEISPHVILQIKRLLNSGNEEYARALLKTVVPSCEETNVIPSVEIKGEGTGTGYTKANYPGLPRALRRLYNDRLVFCLNFGPCAVNCRYCFRRKDMIDDNNITAKEIEDGFQYIADWNKNNPQDPIRDVVFTGGDPLSLSDTKLQKILQRAKSIEGVRILRIDTKYPAAIPQRITPKLTKVLRQAHPLFMTLHFVHPGEFSEETRLACERLADAGIPLGTYTPLLRGINDNQVVLKELFLKCIENRIRPYYLVHFIETEGAQHFKTSIEKGLEILDDIHGHLSGIAVPQYIVYLPTGGGKVPLSPSYLIRKTSEGYWFRNWENEIYLYPYHV